MFDANDLVRVIKKTAVDAVDAGKPAAICFGRVTGMGPMGILVDQKLPIGPAQIVLTKNVTDYTTNVSFEWEGRMESKEVTIHNQLAAGDQVILLRSQGGQKYIVLDKIG